MSTALVVILIGFALAATVLVLVIRRLDRSVRRRYQAPEAEAPPVSAPGPGEPGR